MIDTVRIGTEIRLDPSKLVDRGFRKITQTFKHKTDEEEKQYQQFVKLTDESPHYLKWTPHNDRLVVETSLPKVQFAENISMLADCHIEDTARTMTQRISEAVGEDMPNVLDWEIQGRVDFCFAWNVLDGKHNRIPEYLASMRSLRIPRMVSDSLEKDGTVYWFNRQRRIRAYDKFRETKRSEAKGLLRLEIQINHAKKELDGYNIKHTLRDAANWQTARRVLAYWLDQLSLTRTIRQEEELARAMLERDISPSVVRRVIGSLVVRQMFATDQLEQLGFNRSMFSHDLKILKNAGLSLNVAESAELPALRLPEQFDGSPMKIN